VEAAQKMERWMRVRLRDAAHETRREVMLHSKTRLLGAGVAVAAVAGVGALTYAAVGAGRTLPRLAAERGHVIAAAEAGEPAQDHMAQAGDRVAPPVLKKDMLPPPRDGAARSKAPPHERAATSHEVTRTDRDVRVRAPNTDVDVDKDSGKVRVRAPYTKVDVDQDGGQVRVRAPYVNLDIRW
jgi:hypothetical protein